jgi:hypothetical protein
MMDDSSLEEITKISSLLKRTILDIFQSRQEYLIVFSNVTVNIG